MADLVCQAACLVQNELSLLFNNWLVFLWHLFCVNIANDNIILKQKLEYEPFLNLFKCLKI